MYAPSILVFPQYSVTQCYIHLVQTLKATILPWINGIWNKINLIAYTAAKAVMYDILPWIASWLATGFSCLTYIFSPLSSLAAATVKLLFATASSLFMLIPGVLRYFVICLSNGFHVVVAYALYSYHTNGPVLALCFSVVSFGICYGLVAGSIAVLLRQIAVKLTSSLSRSAT
jgi:hypothetical protein